MEFLLQYRWWRAVVHRTKESRPLFWTFTGVALVGSMAGAAALKEGTDAYQRRYNEDGVRAERVGNASTAASTATQNAKLAKMFEGLERKRQGVPAAGGGGGPGLDNDDDDPVHWHPSARSGGAAVSKPSARVNQAVPRPGGAIPHVGGTMTAAEAARYQEELERRRPRTWWGFLTGKPKPPPPLPPPGSRQQPAS